jgi:hypothetical protein
MCRWNVERGAWKIRGCERVQAIVSRVAQKATAKKTAKIQTKHSFRFNPFSS